MCPETDSNWEARDRTVALKPMKPPAPWFELLLAAAGLMAVMLVMMWIERPAASCTLSFEASRHLVLSRETDREHLETDLAAVDRIARRYMLSAVTPDQQHTRFVECEAALVQQIAAKHGLPPDHLRAGPTETQ
jgi:hypothetical protein